MKIKAACLSIVLCLALCCPAFAVDREMNVVFTPEVLATINEHNEKIDSYLSSKPSTRALSQRILRITPIEQQNGSYCGPACAKMAADYLGLRNDNGSKFTQYEMADIVNYGSNGTYSGDIADGMNDLLGDDIYELVQTSNADLGSSLVYGIDHDYPMFINIKKLPNYSSPVASGHFILGVGYSIYTQGSNTTSEITYNDPRPGYAAQYKISFDEMVTACESKAGNFVRAVP